jgi:hypothetical protein
MPSFRGSPDDNTTTWIKCGKDDIKVGMKIRAVEKYDSGVIVIYEGEIEDLSDSTAGFAGGPAVYLIGGSTWTVELYRQPKQLPMMAGSAILVYDPFFLEERVAVRRLFQKLGSQELMGWFWADGRDPNNAVVPDHLLEDATVLFDAAAR